MDKITGDRKQLIIRRGLLIIYDIIAIYLSAILALLVRFELEFNIGVQNCLTVIHHYILVIIIITLIIFYFSHMYSSLWAYAGVNEMVNIATACILASISQLIIVTYLPPDNDSMP